jgi:putative sugar O-methyltransferase
MNVKILTELLNKIKANGVGRDESINNFWIQQLDRLRICLLEIKGADYSQENVDKVLKALGYNEGKLTLGAGGNRRTKKVGEIIESATNLIPKQQKAFHAQLTGDKSDIEHLCSLIFLSRKGVLDEYINFADRLGLISSMPMARHWWYLKMLKSTLKDNPQTVLEIGAGSGFFASLLMSEPDWSGSYYIVDLPEMLINSVANLSNKFQNAFTSLNSVDSGSDFNINFLETSKIELVPTSSIDCALNFNSLMEMQQSTRDYYIDQIYRVCKPGAMFYNVNRMQRSMANDDGATYINNPLQYPYKMQDQIIYWGPDEFQQDYRSRFSYGATESFAIASMRRVNVSVVSG